MKYIFYLLLLTQIAQAQQSRFKEGETIYVWAEKGLNLRKLPDAKSEKITSLPYGTKVTVQANIGLIVAYEVEEFKGFKVKGVWLLVKYGNKEGFVFDGYMSRLVAPVNFENFEDYFDKKIGKIGNKYNLRIYGDNDEGVPISEPTYADKGQICCFSQKYKNNITITTSDCNEIGAFYNIKCSNLSLFEGYILLKKYANGQKIKFKFDSVKEVLNIEIPQESAGCNYDLKIEKGNLFIIGGCSC